MIAFDSLSNEHIKQRAKAKDICLRFNRDPSKGHLKHLKSLFGEFGDHLIIENGFHCDYGHRIFFGNRVFININCTILDAGKVTISDDCLIGPNVQILAVTHALNPEERLNKENFSLDVTLSKNVWIGAGAILMPGITIGEGAVIGAGSLVSKSVPARSVWAGNPAKPIKVLD